MKLSLLRIASVTLLCLFAGARIASADTLTLTYYNIAANDPDANHLGSGLVGNEVKSTLGPNGQPVLNTTMYGCTVGCFTLTPPGQNSPTSTSIIQSTGEITYWDPSANPFVTKGTSSSVTLPYSDDALFAPNGTGTCDGPSPCDGYQALTLTGNITAGSTETLSFSISSDDMAFVYIDGNLVCSDGGIHGEGSTPCTTPTISAGTHTFLHHTDN
jgi:hypothetical protein